jgi:iron complex outermembrane receptor protein
VQGVEVDFTALLRSGLLLRAAAAFADGRNIDYREGPCPLELQTAATLACDLGGKPLPGLSRWSGTLGLDYTRRLGRGELVLHADTSLRSRHNNDTSASQYTWIAGYGVTNASLGYRAATGWELAVFVRNLFNADYLTALTIQTGNSGLILGQPSDPRLLGFTLRQRWR